VRTVLVVTADRTVAATLVASGIEVADDPLVGLNAAYDRGARLLRERDPRTAVGALQADLPALRPAELDAAIAAALATGGRAFTADAEGTGTTFLLAAAGTALEPRFGGGSAERHRAVGGGAARRGVAEPAPRRRHARRSCCRRAPRRGCPHPRRVGRCVISPSCQGPQGGASASGWDRITAVGDDASRTPGTGPGPEEPRRGGTRSPNRRAPRPSTRRVSPAARAGTATAARATPSAPAAAERPASETPEPLDGSRVALADPTVLEAVAAVPVSPPARTPAPASELPDDRYLNRELSWLDFNARVLASPRTPASRCWSGPSSSRSSRPTSTSSTWCASPG
jgi:hypothetical protein